MREEALMPEFRDRSFVTFTMHITLHRGTWLVLVLTLRFWSGALRDCVHGHLHGSLQSIRHLFFFKGNEHICKNEEFSLQPSVFPDSISFHSG